MLGNRILHIWTIPYLFWTLKASPLDVFFEFLFLLSSRDGVMRFSLQLMFLKNDLKEWEVLILLWLMNRQNEKWYLYLGWCIHIIHVYLLLLTITISLVWTAYFESMAMFKGKVISSTEVSRLICRMYIVQCLHVIVVDLTVYLFSFVKKFTIFQRKHIISTHIAFATRVLDIFFHFCISRPNVYLTIKIYSYTTGGHLAPLPLPKATRKRQGSAYSTIDRISLARSNSDE